MTLFLLSFAALTALAIGLLLPTLLRRRPPAVDAAAVDARRANLHILREQLHALDAEQAAGAIDAAQHAAARAEIERRAIDEEQPAPALTAATRSTGTAVGLGLGIPVFAFFVYGLLGNADAFFPPAASAGAEGGMTQAQVEDMVERLSKRLNGQSAPQEGDAQAWAMLARSQAALERYAESSAAYQRARDLAPGDAPLMADHADVMAMVQGQRVAGEPEALALRALQIDPLSLKALALAGSGAFERKDFAAAARLWARALELAPPGSEFAAGIASSLKDARAGAGSAAPAAGAVAQASAGPGAPTKTASAGGAAQLSGTVQISGTLVGKALPTDTLFVFARAAQGPRMPLAILKHKVSDLPLRFTLDDSSAMSPEMKLSNFSSVVVGARISRSGNAMPQSGDLIGQIGPVAPGSTQLVLTIDGVQP